MRIDVLTLFPEMFESPLSHSILKRAQDADIVEVVLTNIRDFSTDSYKKVDDKPYGGGPGMVMMPGPVFDCFEYVEKLSPEKARVILLTPQGQKFNQTKAADLSKEKRLILIAGRYEGFDERIRIGLGAEQISVGDFVLTGGELAAMIVIDASGYEGAGHPFKRRPRQNRRMETTTGRPANKKMATRPFGLTTFRLTIYYFLFIIEGN
jgi:tRNA (guanine37-N1)-methyltransferase